MLVKEIPRRRKWVNANAEQQGARCETRRHPEEADDDRVPVEALDSAEPGRRVESCAQPSITYMHEFGLDAPI
jgi:hypothetical protein